MIQKKEMIEIDENIAKEIIRYRESENGESIFIERETNRDNEEGTERKTE